MFGPQCKIPGATAIYPFYPGLNASIVLLRERNILVVHLDMFVFAIKQPELTQGKYAVAFGAFLLRRPCRRNLSNYSGRGDS